METARFRGLSPQALLRLALAAVLLAWLGHTRADPDLWGHVLFGEGIVSSGAIPETDPYSFLSDKPWINHEWLAECAMYLAFAVGGASGLVGLKVLLLVGMLVAVASSLRQRQIEGTTRDLLLAFAVLGAFGQIDHIRPQVFSLTAFAVLLSVLSSASAERPIRLAVLPFLFAVWVNLHGGWIVGGGVLALWAVCTLVTKVERTEKAWLMACGAACLLATLANPFGWRMWAFLWNTVGFGRAEITEWQPVYRIHPAFLVVWSVLALAALASAIYARRQLASALLPRVAVVAALAVASFRVNRLLAFFSIALVMLLGRELASLFERIRRRRVHGSPQPSRHAAAVAVGIAVIIICASALAAVENVSCVRIDETRAPDAQVVEHAVKNGLQGRLVVWFDWGEYAIWHLPRSLSVSVDGRRETVYSDAVLNRHLMFYFVPSTRQRFVDEVRPDYIWLPADLPVVSSLQADGWKPLVSGSRSVLLSRDGAPGLLSGLDGASRCFPGP
jgi:hypothetical protein